MTDLVFKLRLNVETTLRMFLAFSLTFLYPMVTFWIWLGEVIMAPPPSFDIAELLYVRVGE